MQKIAGAADNYAGTSSIHAEANRAFVEKSGDDRIPFSVAADRGNRFTRFEPDLGKIAIRFRIEQESDPMISRPGLDPAGRNKKIERLARAHGEHSDVFAVGFQVNPATAR